MTDAIARTPEFTFKERRAASLGFNTTIPGFFLLFLAFIGFILAAFAAAFAAVASAFLSWATCLAISRCRAFAFLSASFA
jgi:hypothetical protein